MKPKFRVEIEDLADVGDLPVTWTDEGYRELLEVLEVADIEALPADELKDMCVMALQDLEPLVAAEHVVGLCLRGLLKEGQIRNESHDLREEALWETYADLKAHEPFFRSAWLISQAHPQEFHKPSIARLEIQVVALNDPAKKRMSHALVEADLLRLLAGGMDSSSILLRMFGEQLKGPDFPEAENLLWTVDVASSEADSVGLKIHASQYMLRGLPDEGSFEVELRVP